MKTITYIIFSLVIISMTMGGFSPTMGQDKVQFSETFKSSEFMVYLNDEDPFFDLIDLSQTDPEDARLGTCTVADAEILWNYLHSTAIQNRIPENLSFAWGWESGEGMRTLYALREPKKQNAPGKKDIQSVSMKQSDQTGSYNLLITFSEDGAKSWATMTRENVNRSIAIVLEGKVVTAPRVMQEIRMGKCLISGNIDKKEASEIKAILEGR
ncbi:MAG: hypothetical protein V2B15_10075 [Bacteroidota bacterium]